jgi:hypothetical protein
VRGDPALGENVLDLAVSYKISLNGPFNGIMHVIAVRAVSRRVDDRTTIARLKLEKQMAAVLAARSALRPMPNR